MSRALDEVMQYANEDVASIHKHWIIFVKMARRILIFGLGDFLVYWKLGHFLNTLFDCINELVPKISFQISKYTMLYCILILLIYSVRQIVMTIIEYKTVGLTINNIQIKGVSGIVSIGQINAPLDQIGSVTSRQSLWGRVFNYGNIHIKLQGTSFIMTDMTDVPKFQESVILLQEAMKESRNMRSDERHDESIKNQTMAQVQAMGMLSQTISQISQALPGAFNNTVVIEENEEMPGGIDGAEGTKLATEEV